ncbi:hypothetical protein PROPEN_03434 [Proteus penneri ATCC 35198]|nr:hypothetical protein PROPEN_03434 [Proteus penneri ATCC 35198]
MPGPLKDNKMRPRIAETAKALWLIYVLLTIICALALWIAGMDVFDAISHSFFNYCDWWNFLLMMPVLVILIVQPLTSLLVYSF